MSKVHKLNQSARSSATGPRTEQGKRRSSLNALRHGLTGQTIVMPGEDMEAYNKHCRSYFTDLSPKGVIEKQLVQTLADATWRLNRARAYETNLFALAFNAGADELNVNHPEAHAALVQAGLFEQQSRMLANLSIYEHRIQRQFDRSLKQLTEMQAERRATDARELHRAAVLKAAHDARQPETHERVKYLHVQDALSPEFVYTNYEIECYMGRHDRWQIAEKAHVARGNSFRQAA